MIQAYSFLDSTRETPQIIQHQVIQLFCQKHGISISFYGAEFLGLESRHNQFKAYICGIKNKHFVFYSIEQFYNAKSGFNLALMNLALSQGISLYFAAENKSLSTLYDLKMFSIECEICSINRYNRDRNDLFS